MRPEDRKKIGEVVTYRRNNYNYPRYDTAVAKGRPIASGVINGACRHLAAYCAFHLKQDCQRNHTVRYQQRTDLRPDRRSHS